jgi:hypothetical protein
MQRLFAEDPMMRRIVDFVPGTETTRPMMILEAFEETLWDARTTPPSARPRSSGSWRAS